MRILLGLQGHYLQELNKSFCLKSGETGRGPELSAAAHLAAWGAPGLSGFIWADDGARTMVEQSAPRPGQYRARTVTWQDARRYLEFGLSVLSE